MESNRQILIKLIFLINLILGSSCTIETPKETYYIRNTDKKIKINGKDNERAWKASNELKAFSSPWSDIPIQRTQFKALYDDAFFYFLFDVEDDKIISIDNQKNDEENAVRSDRVELFFTANKEMNPYITMEMDAEGRLWDAAGTKAGKVDSKWNWSKDNIEIKADKNSSGYMVEGKIRLSAMREIGLIKTDTILCGIMRAEYTSEKDVQWITWINPATSSANFHHKGIFGRLILQ